MIRWAELDRRRRGLALVVAGACLMALGGFLVTLLVESPREAAAKAGPPAPSLIAVPVEQRQVGEELVTRGQVTATRTVEAITPLAGAGARVALVSAPLPAVGSTVRHGQVVAEISGRPVLALEGGVPAYRDLGPGDVGDDVRRLNKALSAAGLGTSPRSRRYDATTQDAVARLYRRAGYESDGSLPAAEVAFVAALPATAVAVKGHVGSPVSGSSVRIASGALTVVASFSAGQAGLVEAGTNVVLSSEVLGKSAEAKVTGTRATTAADEGAGGGAAAADVVVITPDRPLPGAWIGQDVRVRVVGATTAEKVLAVPVTAVVANGSGDAEVVVVDAGADTIGEAHPRRVRVRTGVTGGGWVEVQALEGRLEAGDLVQLSASVGVRHP